MTCRPIVATLLVLALPLSVLGQSKKFTRPDAKLTEELATTLKAAMKGYNEADREVFYADFATALKESKRSTSKEAFEAIYVKGFHPQFGDFVELGALVVPSSSVSDKGALTEFEAKFENSPRTRLTVGWIKEGDGFKLVQVQFKKLATAQP